MRRSSCYFPIVPNKPGEIKAISHLSPHARALTRIIFEINRPRGLNASELEVHISDAARQINAAWGTANPLLVDLPEYGPEHCAINGTPLIKYAYNCLSQLRMLAVPVAEPVSARGPEVLKVIRDIALHEHRGVALRIPFYELSHTDVLQLELKTAMHILALDSLEVDILLDLEAVPHIPERQRNAIYLTTLLGEALAVVQKVGDFRNIVLCGSSVPESVGKEYNGTACRVKRTEYDVWKNLLSNYKLTISFSDNVVTAPRGPDSLGQGLPPARIRLSTPTEYVFHRGPRKEYRNLCKRVLSSADFSQGIMSWGASELIGCARGNIKESSATVWFARDGNLHIEATVIEVEKQLRLSGHIAAYKFPKEDISPWLQQTILEVEQA